MNNGSGKNGRPLAATAIGVGVVFALLFAWKVIRATQPMPPAPPPLAVAAIEVHSRSVPAELQTVGTLQAVQEVLLAPDTAGRVTAIRFEAGRIVSAGTVLVQLYDAPEQADRASAVAQEELARLQLQRSLELGPVGAESHEVLEQRQSQEAQAAAAVRQLDARIAQKSIRAPFSGQLGIRRINVGQYLNAGDPIATLTRLDPLYVNFSVPQQEIPKLQPGAPVKVSVDAWPGQEFTASLSTIEPRIDGDTRNVVVQALLGNDDHKLKSGMYATVRVILPVATEAVVLPLTAILTSASGDTVIIVQTPNSQGVGKVSVVPVKTGNRIGDEVVVEEGVKPGDVVVTAGQLRVPPGAVVKVSAASALTTR